MSFYTTAIEGIPKMLLSIENPMEGFKRKQFPDVFKAYYETHRPTLEAIENGYNTVVDKEQFLTNMAYALADAAKESIDKKPKKSQRENLLMDYNFCLAVYIYPAILEFRGASTEILVQKVGEAWKDRFPRSNVQPAGYEQINAGFKRKFCYITTAVCRTFGKPDDCYELNCFRNYRDEYLMSSEEGEEAVRTYYDLAPTIVKHIDRKENAGEIYRNIWDVYLNPCLRMIEQKQYPECQELYTRMVRNLQKEYFFEN